MKLLVRNLDRLTTEEELEGIFSEFGEIEYCTIVMDPKSGSSKGFGFIEPSDGSKDAFVHISAVQRAGLTGLNEGQEVEYELIPDQRDRLSADNLRVVG